MAKNSGTSVETPDATTILMPRQALVKLLNLSRATSKEVAELNGELREEIGNAKERRGLHTKAFSVMGWCWRKEPEKVAEFWYHLNHYMKESGLLEKIEKIGRLPLNDAGADEPGGAPSKVSRLSDRRRAAAEQEAQAAAE